MLLLVILVLILAGGLGYLYYSRSRDNQRAADQKARDEAQTSSAKSSSTEESAGPKSGGDAKSSSTTTDQVPTTSDGKITIDSFSQANGMVNASATAIGSAAGTCVFTFTTADSKPVTASSSSGSNQTCSTSISEVEFNKVGSWNLNVTFYVNGGKIEASREVTIN